jgi:hypothetical protein
MHFFPKGLCRRGAECPYSHDTAGAQPKAKAVPAAPKSKPGLVAMLVMGTAANVATSASVASSSFDIEFALDSGAGEDLGSIPAFMRQGVPQELIQDVETISSNPLRFETGGGVKDSSKTIGIQGESTGEGLIYMLKSCPYVRSLGKLVEKGFSFFR